MNFLRIKNCVFPVQNVQPVRIRDEKYVTVAATVSTIPILTGRLNIVHSSAHTNVHSRC